MQELRYIGTRPTDKDCTWQIVGLPYDQTCSFRKGTRWGPAEIRRVSDSIETFCPYCRRDLEDLLIYDAGDLAITALPPDKAVATIAKYYEKASRNGKRLFGLGGEHSVTIGAVKGLVAAGVKPYVIQLDAHLDLREEYDGTPYSHACVARCIAELVGPDHIVQWGMRSGERTEFEWAWENRTYYGEDVDSLSVACTSLRGKPVYLSIDLDVLNPAHLPGVGNPEPGGIRPDVILKVLDDFAQLDIIGVDVVELSPVWDTSGMSSVTTAELIRELLLTVVH